MTTFQVTDIGAAKEIDRYTIWLFEDNKFTGDYITTNGYPDGFYQHGHSASQEVFESEKIIDVSELPSECWLTLLKEFQAEE